MVYVLIISVLLVLATITTGVACVKNVVSNNSARKFLGINVLTLFAMLIGATILLFPEFASAAGEAGSASSSEGLRYLGAALSTGLAAIGAGIAVATSASAALGAISENPKIFGKTLIFVGLAEGIAIYGLIVSILILP